MTIIEAFQLVANQDFKESHRRFAPQHGLLQFDRHGVVTSVYRFKAVPHEKEQCESLSKHPGCLQISTMPHWFATAEDLQKRIDRDLHLFAHMKPRTTDE